MHRRMFSSNFDDDDDDDFPESMLADMLQGRLQLFSESSPLRQVVSARGEPPRSRMAEYVERSFPSRRPGLGLALGQRDGRRRLEDVITAMNGGYREVSMAELLERYRKLFRETVPLWRAVVSKREGAKDSLEEHLVKVRNSYHAYRGQAQSQRYLELLGESLVESGTVTVLCDIIASRQIGRTPDDCVDSAITTLLNFTDRGSRVPVAIGQHDGALGTLLAYLEHCYTVGQGGSLKIVNTDFTVTCLALLDNISKKEESMQYVKSLTGVYSVIKKLIDSGVAVVKFLAITILAAVATEEQAETMATSSDIITFLLSHFKTALNDSDRKVVFGSLCLNSYDFANAVKQLSRNTLNSQRLVERGVLPLLLQGLKSKGAEDRIECIHALWWLSFVKENKTAISREDRLMEVVEGIFQKANDPCHQAAEGILFQMRKADDRAKKTMKVVEEKTAPTKEGQSGTGNTSKDFHVMLSYQSGNRKMVKTVCDFLKSQGIAVWMDIYNMAEGETSTAQTMAEAVERAAVFVMCVSEGYKNSQFCRSEAEYAYENQKSIIPLKLQRNYKPDGWLGFIQGSKYFYDLSKDDGLDQKLQRLFSAVRKAYNNDCTDGATAPAEENESVPVWVPVVHAVPKAKPWEVVKDWTQTQVDDWLDKHQLTGDTTKDMTSSEIGLLLRMQTEASAQFYQFLMSRLKQNWGLIAKMTFALDSLTKEL